MRILGQVRLSKGQLSPVRLGKGLEQGTVGLKTQTGARNRKEKKNQLIFNNPKSGISPGSAPDNCFFSWDQRGSYIRGSYIRGSDMEIRTGRDEN